MKSICIKLTSQKATKYLLEKFDSFEMDNTYFSCKKFKFYYNVIIHFKGNNTDFFLKILSQTLSLSIIDLYEKNIIDSLIKSEYFYFDSNERKKIANITYEDLYDREEALYSPSDRFNLLFNKIFDYLNTNRSLIFKGFITFRLKEYFEYLLEQIDKSVNKFIVEREYYEFISLLRIYINSEKNSCNEIHIIYHNLKPILLDEYKNVINVENNLLNGKYLSDITFSSNDCALNTLLNLVPNKIYIHLIDDNIDEFINTIKLIFEDRVTFCTDCSICKKFKKSHAIKV